MPTRSFSLAALVLAASAVVMTPRTSEASGTKSAGAAASGEQSWCAPEVEKLPGDVCYLDGRTKGPRRTLVIFLHGAIAKNTTWSWNHERQILRLAKAHGIEVMFPRSPLTETGYVWPGTADSQERVEQRLIDNWMDAKSVLEKRENRTYDEVFVMGFSSGAYFTSSLAMRGRVDVDGYAVFAGGQPMPAPAAPVVRRAPVFIGVCADDPTGTAAHSRAFASSVAAAGIPRLVVEQHVGHGLDHVHFNSALAFLRRQREAQAPKS
jgi:predicted esterase